MPHLNGAFETSWEKACSVRTSRSQKVVIAKKKTGASDETDLTESQDGSHGILGHGHQ